MNSNDVVLITGASKGLGFALAKEFSRRRHPLIINARREDELRRAAAELSSTDVLAVPGDVSEVAEVIAERALEKFGRVDILINNASEIGPSPMPALLDQPWQSLERIFRVNVIAPIHLTQLLRPSTIVNITSDAAVNAYPHWGGYGASKAALEHASRILAKECPETRVLVIDPGDMNTEMHAMAEPGVDLSRLPKPEDVAPRIIARLEAEAVEAVA
jgi:NAD(P)-dependent dehydrogenase (short-subunit alcohol dehydrogenase family)